MPEDSDYKPERLTPIQVFGEILQGIAIAFGLALLWMMELVRDGTFRLLDALNRKPRERGASAFPPGRPRRHRVKQAETSR
jgi:hypothetical protein